LCWFDITVDISSDLSSRLDQRKKKTQTFYQSDKTMIHHVSWLQKYVIRFNLSEKLLDCEKAEMAAWQECSSLVLIILRVDLPGHPKPCINSGEELRWPTQRCQKILAKEKETLFSLTLTRLYQQTHITMIS
jgi:hypothetical protein